MAAVSFYTFLTVLTVIGMAASQTIGNCNLTFFTSGGLLCQRTMIDDMKNDPNLTCSEANDNQTSCLRSHVSACVSGDPLLSNFGGAITSLLSTLLYNCGNFNFTAEPVNPTILQIAQCSNDKLKDIGDCWNEFHSTFKQNRNDSSLCRKYADSKQTCSNIAREACGLICNHVEKDEYNPFCADKADPAGTSEMYDCDRTLGCQESLVYEEAMKCEMERFTDFANMTEDDCSTELDKNKLCLRNKLFNICPKMSKSASLFEEAVKVLRATLMTKRFFCQKVDLDRDSIDDRLRKTIPCNDDFSDAAEECADPFRNLYISAKVKKDNEVCKAFATAKQCLNNAHKDHCTFDDATIKAAMFDDRNPFCESGKDPKIGSGAEKTQMATLTVFVLSLSAIFITQ